MVTLLRGYDHRCSQKHEQALMVFSGMPLLDDVISIEEETPRAGRDLGSGTCGLSSTVAIIEQGPPLRRGSSAGAAGLRALPRYRVAPCQVEAEAAIETRVSHRCAERPAGGRSSGDDHGDRHPSGDPPRGCRRACKGYAKALRSKGLLCSFIVRFLQPTFWEALF